MNQDTYIKLIYKELQGALSSEDALVLQNWLAESEEHQQLKESIKAAYNLLDDFEPPFEIDAKADYRKLRQQMQVPPATPQAKAKTVSLFSRRRVWSIAASVLFIVAAAWLYQYLQAPALEMMVAETQAGEIKQIELADRSQVWLNENSRLEYPKQFGGAERAVALKGEAFFEVIPNAQQPFRIATEQATVEVLGTAFNVRAIAAEALTSVAVESGKVRFSAKAIEKAVILKKAESASLSHDKLEMVKIKTTDSNASAWKTKQLSFKSRPLGEVLQMMEQHFGVQIELRNSALRDCLFSMPRQELDLEQLGQNLVILYEIEWEKTGEKSYLIRGGRCE